MNKVIKTSKEILEENELSHHGVLGMKWDVRKDRDSSSDKQLKTMVKKRCQKISK